MDTEDDTTEPTYDRLTLETLKLPSGGWVSFNDPEDLTGNDVRRLRKALDAEGQGSSTNNFYEQAMVLLIADWDIPGKPGLVIPRHDKSQKQQSSGKLSARDLRAIEKHLAPTLKSLAGGDEEDDDDQSPR